MKQAGNRHGLFRRRFVHQEQETLRILIHVNGMLAQPAGIIPVIMLAGRCRKEIRLLQPGQQVLQAFPPDTRPADRQKLLLSMKEIADKWDVHISQVYKDKDKIIRMIQEKLGSKTKEEDR